MISYIHRSIILVKSSGIRVFAGTQCNYMALPFNNRILAKPLQNK